MTPRDRIVTAVNLIILGAVVVFAVVKCAPVGVADPVRASNPTDVSHE